MYQEAEKYLLENQNEYPPATYSIALLEFRKQNYIKAATALRKGIAQNPYIAEILTGRKELTPHLYWHSSNLSAPETANYIRGKIAGMRYGPQHRKLLIFVIGCLIVQRS